jgi:nucleotide-binding universal stress UspA family protein
MLITGGESPSVRAQRAEGDVYKLVLVPIDGSETARLGLEEAIKLAEHQNAAICLIHVINSLPWVDSQNFPTSRADTHRSAAQ